MSDQIQRDDAEWQMLLNNAHSMVESLTNKVEARDTQIKSLRLEKAAYEALINDDGSLESHEECIWMLADYRDAYKKLGSVEALYEQIRKLQRENEESDGLIGTYQEELESLQREKAETDAELKRAYADLESIRRENEELRSLRDLKSADGAELNMRANLLGLIDPDLSNTHDSYTVFQLAWIEITNQRRRISELEAAAITPEMRDRIRAYLNWSESAVLSRPPEHSAVIFRDLLGEQDA